MCLWSSACGDLGVGKSCGLLIRGWEAQISQRPATPPQPPANALEGKYQTPFVPRGAPGYMRVPQVSRNSSLSHRATLQDQAPPKTRPQQAEERPRAYQRPSGLGDHTVQRAMPADNATSNEGASLLPTAAPPPGAPAAAAAAGRKPDFLLWCCRLFNLITAICALLCAIALGIAMALQAGSPVKVRHATTKDY